jgi:hypothetical protein
MKPKPLFRAILIFTFVALLSGIFTACSPERRLARQFVSLKEPVTVLLVNPDIVYKKSYKVPDSLDLSRLSEREADSALFIQTRLLQYTNDSIFIDAFIQGMVSALHTAGVKIYAADSSLRFIQAETPAYIVNVAQLQLEEYYDSLVTAPDIFNDDQVYVIYYTAVNMNSWYELSRLNSESSDRQILFNSKTVQDYVDGGMRYVPISGDYKFISSIDSLSLSDVYELAGHVGFMNGNQLFDYIMNAWIRQHLPQQSGVVKMFSFNPISGELKRSNTSGFIPLNN